MAEIITYTSPSYQSWSTSNSQVTNCLYAMLSKYDNRFSHVEDSNVIRVNDQFNISITTTGIGSSYLYWAVVSVMDPNNSSTVLATYNFRYADWNSLPGSWNCKLVKTNNIFYLSFSATNASQNWSRLGGIIYWFIKDNKSYFGIFGNSDNFICYQPDMNIENMSLINVNDNSTYYIRKIADYNMNIDELFFTKTNVMSDVAGNFVTSDDLYSSSEVANGKTFSIGGKNYYALGTNTLIELTS